MKEYKLLTPGPLTTTKTVKEAMLVDHCTWDDDYKQITIDIRKDLLKVAHCDEDKYTVVLFQGSGTYGVEAVFGSVITPSDKILIVTNGMYGTRMVEIASMMGLNYEEMAFGFNEIPCHNKIDEYLKANTDITHVAMVHSETTTGILNDIASVAKAVKGNDRVYIVDAMSSFGGVDIDVQSLDIDFLISSANKCIQGVPGFVFIIGKTDLVKATKGNSKSLSLDLYAQWSQMDADGKWRFTSPTHVVLAFAQALKEFKEEGGSVGRNKRYQANMDLLIKDFSELSLESYVDAKYQSPIIATFKYPEGNFEFLDMYNYVKERGYAIYPGKLNNMDTFRIGVIGEIYPEDITKLSSIMKSYFDSKK